MNIKMKIFNIERMANGKFAVQLAGVFEPEHDAEEARIKVMRAGDVFKLPGIKVLPPRQLAEQKVGHNPTHKTN